MCKRRDAIDKQNAAADELARVCAARTAYVDLNGDLLRDRSTLRHLPKRPPDFDELIEKLNQIN